MEGHGSSAHVLGEGAGPASALSRQLAEPATHTQPPPATAPDASAGAPSTGAALSGRGTGTSTGTGAGTSTGTGFGTGVGAGAHTGTGTGTGTVTDPGDLRQTTPTTAAAGAASALHEGRGRGTQPPVGAYARKAAAGPSLVGDPWASVATPLGVPHSSGPLRGTAGSTSKAAASVGRPSYWVTVWAALMTAVNVGLVILMARMGSGTYAVDPISRYLLQQRPANTAELRQGALSPPALALAPTAAGNATEDLAAVAGAAAACVCPPVPACKPPPPCASSPRGGGASARPIPKAQAKAKAPRPLTLHEALRATPRCTKAAYVTKGPTSPWYSLKGIPPPAECRVQGFVIESLEPQLNYRRPYTLRISADPEEKMHLLPYLRAFQDTTMATRQRRVLLDLGGNFFQTSVLWFMRHYPLDFTEVHVFESVRGRFRKPRPGKPIEDLVRTINTRSEASTQALQFPKWALDRIHVHQMLVGNHDKRAPNKALTAINITRFIRNTLKLKRDDAVVVKMDIERAEWDVLPVWLADREMPYIVDDLFVEVHYKHKTMFKFHWKGGPPRNQAQRLFQELRKKGFFVHPWP